MKKIFLLLILISVSTYLRAQWEQTSGPSGSDAFNAFLTKGDTIYGATERGLVVSNNKGKAWIPINNGLTSKRVFSLAKNNNVLLAATYLGGPGTFFGGAYISINNGQSWYPANTMLSQNITSVCIKNNLLYLGTYNGVYVSADNGITWTSSGIIGKHIYNLLTNGNSIMAATENDGIFLSIDNGSTWNPVNSGLPSLTTACFTSNGSTLYTVLFNNYNYIPVIYFSNNNGTTWSPVSNGSGAPDKTIYSLTVINNDIYAVSFDNGIYKSSNNGVTWQLIKPTTIASPVVIAVMDGIIFSGTPQGLYISNASLTDWKLTEIPLATSYITSLYSFNNTVFALSNTSICTTADMGKHWESNKSITNEYFNCMHAKSTTLFAGYANGIAISGDSGKTWNKVNNGLPSGQYARITSITSIKNRLFAFVGAGNGLYYSDNNGTNWTKVSINVGHDSNYASCVTTYGDTLYLGGYGGIIMSADLGVTWSVKPTPPQFPNAMAFQDSLWIIGSGVNMLISKDFGLTWEQTHDGGIVNNYINRIYTYKNIILAGFNGNGGTESIGVLVSFDKGKTWETWNTGLTNKAVTSFLIADSTVYAGTNGSGVFRTPLSEFKHIATGVDNYSTNQTIIKTSPNPASDLITFTLSEQEDTHPLILKIYNLTGELKKHEKFSSTSGKYTLSVNDFKDGIYFFEIEDAGNITRGKIVVLH